MSGLSARSLLGFLTLVGLPLLGPACGGGQLPSPDGGQANCATRGCGVAPMCGSACTDVCGCCPCSPGTLWSDLVCTDQGCYESRAAACTLPFDAGPCRAAIPVYAFIDGACVPATYGGCEGNDNRFGTLEDCLAVCEGRPARNACPSGRVAQSICLACGPVGGCSHYTTACALPCMVNDSGVGVPTCPSELPICFQGVCQNAYCE